LKLEILETGIYNPNGNWKKCKPFYATEIETAKSENRYLKTKWKPIKSKTGNQNQNRNQNLSFRFQALHKIHF